MSDLSALPVEVKNCLEAFVEAAKAAFGGELVSILIYGSAAEGRMRATSDVNTLLVLKHFTQANADLLREPLRLAHAAVELNAMFMLEAEIPLAMEAFAVKFSDIAGRHQVLYGADPFLNVDPPREAIIRRLKQVLLNLQLRLRERYVLVSLREEQLALVIADAAAPLRSSAASLLQLEGQRAASPKDALETVVREMNEATLTNALREVSLAREERQLLPGHAAGTVMALLAMTARLQERIEKLS